MHLAPIIAFSIGLTSSPTLAANAIVEPPLPKLVFSKSTPQYNPQLYLACPETASFLWHNYSSYAVEVFYTYSDNGYDLEAPDGGTTLTITEPFTNGERSSMEGATSSMSFWMVVPNAGKSPRLNTVMILEPHNGPLGLSGCVIREMHIAETTYID